MYMARQLSLLEKPAQWRIDAATREAGRRGVAEARATLQAALAKAAHDDARDDARSGPHKPERVRRGEHPTHKRSAA
jgi:hypothetical protein